MKRTVIPGLAVLLLLTGCASTVQPQQAVNKLSANSGTKYSTQECSQARQAALAYDDNVAGRMGIGLGLGLFLGPFGLPLALAADMSQSEKREAILAELSKHCEGDVPLLTTGVAPAAAAGPGVGSGDVLARLELLKELKAKGLLTEEEFTTKRLQLVDSAVSGVRAPGVAMSPTVAVRPEPLRLDPLVGLRLTMSEREPISGTTIGENTLTVSAVTPQTIEFNDGQVRINRQDQTLVKGSLGMAGVFGFSLKDLAPGSRLPAKFAPGVVGSEVVPVTLKVIGIEQLNMSGALVRAARADLTGYASREVTYGMPVSARGAVISGTVLIDLTTGLVVAGEIKSVNTTYSMRRDLQRVVRPATL